MAGAMLAILAFLGPTSAGLMPRGETGGFLPVTPLERCQQLQDEITEHVVIGLDARELPVELLDNVLDLCNGWEWR